MLKYTNWPVTKPFIYCISGNDCWWTKNHEKSIKDDSWIVLCQNAGMVRKFLGVQTIEHHRWLKCGISWHITIPSPLKTLPGLYSGLRITQQGLHSLVPGGWEDPPLQHMGSQHWAMACPPMGPTRDWMERQKASKGFSSLANTRGVGQELRDHVFFYSQFRVCRSWESKTCLMQAEAAKGKRHFLSEHNSFLSEIQNRQLLSD